VRNIRNWIIAATAVAVGLASVGSAHSQPVTGDATLDNLVPGDITYYAGWSPSPTSATIGPSGLEIVSPATYGSLYYAVPAVQHQTLNTADNLATLVMTLHGATQNPANVNSGYWLGIPFILNDNSGSVMYGGYAGEFGYTGTGTATWTPAANGWTVTEAVPLTLGQQAAIAAGGDTIYGFNLEVDPAVYPGSSYDVTFNSLTLSQVPEPSTLALAGLGFAAVLAFNARSSKQRLARIQVLPRC